MFYTGVIGGFDVPLVSYSSPQLFYFYFFLLLDIIFQVCM